MNTDTYPMEPVQVHVTKVTHDDVGIPVSLRQTAFQLARMDDEKASETSLGTKDAIHC